MPVRIFRILAYTVTVQEYYEGGTRRKRDKRTVCTIKDINGREVFHAGAEDSARQWLAEKLGYNTQEVISWTDLNFD